jgi:predicted LPLAT superfamily acyltransferase
MSIHGDSGLTERGIPEWTTSAERGTVRGLRFMAWVALRIGRTFARLLLYPVCLYFVIFSPRTRRVSRKYLQKILARKPRLSDVFQHVRTFAATVLDRFFLFSGQHALFDVHVHDEHVVADMVARGEGGFLLGAHMGSFEMVRATSRATPVSRVSLVMYEDNARKLNAVLDAINPALRLQVIAMGRSDSMLKVESALEHGGFVGMLADRTIQGEGTIACTFLGAEAHFPSGPLRLACMLKQQVVLMVGLYRGGNRYDVFFEPLADLRNVAREERNEILAQTLQRYVSRLEHYCALEPYNWYNFYDFWK